MNVVLNEVKVRRNARIGQVTSLIGLAVLLAGMVISFTRPDLFQLSLLALLAGFLLSQIGIHFGNRFGRRPRQDEIVSQALKGLDGRYSLYHYTSPTSHLLVGPAGVWVLMPKYQRGRIVYEKGRWKQKGGGLWLAYMRLFAQEGLGRPDLEIQAELDTVKKFLDKKVGDEEELPEINAALIFTNDKAILEADEAPVATVSVKKIKDLIRKSAKDSPLPAPKYKRIQEALEAEA